MGRVEIPKYLLKLDFMLKSVAFIAVFSVLFMIIYSPFSVTEWFDIFNESRLPMSVVFYIAAVAIMVISKVLMIWAQSRITIDAGRYILWLLGEIVAISLLYTFFTVILVGSELDNPPLQIAGRIFFCVTAILAIPYVILFLYAAYKSKLDEDEALRYHANHGAAENCGLINLYDSNGVVKLTIDVDSLYYMESQDNYVKIYYENDGSLHNYMLRCRTKTLENHLAGTPMVRCHRSYIINISKIKLLRPDRANSIVFLKHPNIKPIPVSKSYYNRLVGMIAAANPPAGQENETETQDE